MDHLLLITTKDQALHLMNLGSDSEFHWAIHFLSNRNIKTNLLLDSLDICILSLTGAASFSGMLSAEDATVCLSCLIKSGIEKLYIGFELLQAPCSVRHVTSCISSSVVLDLGEDDVSELAPGTGDSSNALLQSW